MEIKENYSLKNKNTFGIDSRAMYYCEVTKPESILRLMDSQVFADNPLLVIGEGSNILFVEDFFPGLIIENQIKGMKILPSEDNNVIIEVGAGEKWDDFIRSCLKNKLYGLENLALIPGKVGAAPVQNIGAYGSEQKDFFQTLNCIFLENGNTEELSKDDCKFGYRDSIFKNDLRDKTIITGVRYILRRTQNINLYYTELKKEVEKFNIPKPDAEYVYQTVSRLRKQKLPDLSQIGCAGSFFKNPVINSSRYFELKDEFPDVKTFNLTSEKMKVSAAWLIEQSGWKGKRFGDAGVFDKHSLILCNYGKAKGIDILNLAKLIISSVVDKFKITLEPEVVIIK